MTTSLVFDCQCDGSRDGSTTTQWLKPMPETVIVRPHLADGSSGIIPGRNRERGGCRSGATSLQGRDVRVRVGRRREHKSRRPRLAMRLSQSVRDWLSRRVGSPSVLVTREFEDVMHRFAASIDRADDPAVVEAELLRIVRQMAPSSRIELVLEGESHGHDESENAGGAAECRISRTGRVQEFWISRCDAVRRSAPGSAFALERAARLGTEQKTSDV